jgi:hypothetical protein
VLVAYTTLAVCFCFFMVFLAAILQGWCYEGLRIN